MAKEVYTDSQGNEIPINSAPTYASQMPLSPTDDTDTASAIGDLSDLDTTDKSSLVGAVNEVNGSKATAQEIDGVTLACSRCPISSISNSKAYASGKMNYFSTVITFGSTGEASAAYFQCSLFGASDFCFGNLYDNNSDKSYTITKGNSTSLWVFDGSTRVNANTFAGKSNMYLNLIGIKP